ncbi:MAG: SBBP repeat-containing protein [candidate division WOR-3 bacterium]|nr:MAG: SBBP repeat-containing protein [candidate division WOR-3 bacterium]
MKYHKSLFVTLVALVVYLPHLASAQVDTVWANRWTSPGAESDWAYALATDNEGRVYVTGKTNNAGTADDWTTIKYKQNGDTAWVRNYANPGSYNERANSIAIGPAGNIYITGYTMSSSAGDYFTIKYKPDGNVSWTRVYNGVGNGYDFSNWVTVDADENVYITGYSRALSYQNDIATVKYDSSGTQLWVALFDGPGNYNDEGHKVIADGNGYIYVVGFVNPYSSGVLRDYVTIKYDAETGDTAWVRTYNGTADSSDMARDITVDAAGNVYVTGSSRHSGTLSDIITIKYDSSGTEQWTAQYNNPDTSLSDGGYGVAVDAEGNVFVVGQSQGLGTGSDIVTIKYDSLGNQQWVTRYNGPANDYDTPSTEDGGKCMAIDADGNIYITGVSRGAASGNDFVTIMYNTEGVEQWVAGYNYCDSVDTALDIDIDTLGGIYVCGRSIGLGTYYDMAAVKYKSTVGIDENTVVSADRLRLEIYPNPFSNLTDIRWQITDNGSTGSDAGASLRIYDASGRMVRDFAQEAAIGNQSSVMWDGTDANNRCVPDGVYFCVLEVDGQRVQQKIVSVK